MKLKNKTAIVTGASSGLGLAIAQALIEKDVRVYGLARNKERLQTAQKKMGDQFIPVSIDVSDNQEITAWINQTFSAENCPAILINNAGVGGFEKVDEMSADYWLKMINVNLNALYFITSKIAALMKKKPAAQHIINIGSILGKIGRAEGTAYCASKFGVQGFSEALYKELRFHGIKVTCVNPGSINTEFFKSSGIQNHSHMLNPKDLANTIIHVLETPDNMLINELTLRPLNPKPVK